MKCFAFFTARTIQFGSFTGIFLSCIRRTSPAEHTAGRNTSLITLDFSYFPCHPKISKRKLIRLALLLFLYYIPFSFKERAGSQTNFGCYPHNPGCNCMPFYFIQKLRSNTCALKLFYIIFSCLGMNGTIHNSFHMVLLLLSSY